MNKRKILLIGLILIFFMAIGGALTREMLREESKLSQSISGIADVSPALLASGKADLVRTDRLILVLIDPVTREAVAFKYISTLTLPLTIFIGQESASVQGKLSGSYLLVGITDKDGEVSKNTPGEVYGRSSEPIPMGTEKIKLILNEPYRGGLFNEGSE